MKSVIYLRDRPSPQKKWLEKEKDVENGIQYKLKTIWPNAPEFDNLYRIGFNKDKSINFIDFDGGPLLYKGYTYLNYTIQDIFQDNDEIKVILSNG